MWSKVRTFLRSINGVLLSPVPPIIAINEDSNRNRPPPRFNRPSNGPPTFNRSFNGPPTFNHSNYMNDDYNQFNQNNSNSYNHNSALLPSLDTLTAAIEEKDNKVISKYENQNKRRSKIKRNDWVLGKFIGYLGVRVPLTEEATDHIRKHPLKLIPKYYCSDKVLAAFITWSSESALASSNKYKSWIRALESTLSDMCAEYRFAVDFKSSQFFKAKAVMASCKSSEVYKKDQPTQARACSNEERKQAMNVHLIKENGEIDDMILTEKSGYVLSTGFMARGDEIYRGLDQDLMFVSDDNGSIYVQLKIFTDKTRTRSYFKTIYCDEIHAHDPLNYNENACPVAVLQLYQQRKQQSIVYIKDNSRLTSKRSKAIVADPLQGALVRRVKQKKQSDLSKGTYISVQRRGENQLDFIQQIAERLKWDMDVRLGQSDIFGKHSGTYIFTFT
eukprot:69597_1